jgi:hypothetical protein
MDAAATMSNPAVEIRIVSLRLSPVSYLAPHPEVQRARLLAAGLTLGQFRSRPSAKRVSDDRRDKTKRNEPTHGPDQQPHHAAVFP